MIFSVDTIKESANKSLPRNTVTESFSDFSFFESTLMGIIDEQSEFEYTISCVCEGLVGDKVVSKIKSIKISDIISKIFDWFINAIKKLNDIFIGLLVKLINKDKRIKLYGKKIQNYMGSIVYNHPYFIYTNIITDNGFASFEEDIKRETETLVQCVNDLTQYTNTETLSNVLSTIKDETARYADDLSIIRGKIVGKNRLVQSTEFGEELFMYFRNGSSKPTSTHNHTITPDGIQKAYNDYNSLDKQKLIVQRESKKLTSKANEQKKKICSTKITDFVDKSIVDRNVLNTYKGIVDIKCRKLKDICDIYRIYYSARLEAINNFNKQNETILTDVISEIVKGGKK